MSTSSFPESNSQVGMDIEKTKRPSDLIKAIHLMDLHVCVGIGFQDGVM